MDFVWAASHVVDYKRSILWLVYFVSQHWPMSEHVKEFPAPQGWTIFHCIDRLSSACFLYLVMTGSFSPLGCCNQCYFEHGYASSWDSAFNWKKKTASDNIKNWWGQIFKKKHSYTLLVGVYINNLFCKTTWHL